MMLVAKAEYEKRLATGFLEMLNLPPDVARLPDGSGPDFRIMLGDEPVGLELTRLYRDDTDAGASFRQLEGLQYQVAGGAQRRWDDRRGPPVVVYIHFLPRSAPKKAEIPRLAEALVQLVEARLPDLGGIVSIDREWGRSNVVPNGVSGITICRPPRATSSAWFVPQSGMVPDLSADTVQTRITSKNQRLARYTSRPPRNWLLLVAEGFGASSTFTFTEEALEHVYESSFERTYLLEAFSRRLERLKTHNRTVAA